MYKRKDAKFNAMLAERADTIRYFRQIGIETAPIPTRSVVTMTIDEVGDIKMLDAPGSEICLGMGDSVTRRASHVYPVNFVKRGAFKALRFVFGDEGRVAEWTRGWHGWWMVDTTPTAGVVLPLRYNSHALAVKAEIEFLNDYFLRGAK